MAFFLSILIFVFWTTVGYALVATLFSRRNVMQGLLLAPVSGMAVTALAIFWINRFGLPVKQFAPHLAFVLLGVSAAILAVRRPVIPFRRCIPFVLVLSLGLIAVGWPLLLHGFEWIAYGNEDMLTLSNAAQYFLNFGFFDGPNADDLLHERDFSQYSWFLYVVGMHRVGNEMLLSWVAALCHLRPDQVFMSLTVALQLVLVSAVAALVMQSRRFRLATLLTGLLVALSPLGAQAVVNQLSSQIGGLALLAAAAAMWMHPAATTRTNQFLRQGVLAGVVTAAMLLYYPESSPFLALSVALYFGLSVIRRQMPIKSVLTATGLVMLVCLIVLNKQLGAVAFHLWRAIDMGGATVQVVSQTSTFPYFFKPIGLAIMWGFQTFNTPASGFMGSLSIALGGVLLFLAIGAAVWKSWQRAPIALVALVMLLLAMRLYSTNSDFGLFKMVFFMQPFVLGALVVAWLALVKSTWMRVMPVLLLAVVGLNSLSFYTSLSADQTASSVEIWRGSARQVKREFDVLISSIPSTRLVLDTPNFLLAGLQSLQLRGKEATFTLDMARIRRGKSTDSSLHALALDALLSNRVKQTFSTLDQQILEQRRSNYPLIQFELVPHREHVNFAPRKFPEGEDVWFISTAVQQSLFNRQHPATSNGGTFSAMPIRNVSNHLVFVNSNKGRQHVLARGGATSFYQLEPDYFFPGRTMSGIGRHLLFRIMNPSEQVRLLLDMTSSYKGDGENLLSPTSVVGAEATSLPLIGRGSARVFSFPITPQWIDGAPYVALEVQATGKPFPVEQTGLAALYGKDILLDHRLLVGFARDISLMSEDQYQQLVAPASLSRFPFDLGQASLEYSGFYEDGWMSEATAFTLSQSSGSGFLRIVGAIPLISDKKFKTEVSVLIDGAEVTRQTLELGDFSIVIPVPDSAPKRRVEMRFSQSQQFVGNDKRVVTAKLNYIGFEGGAPKREHNDSGKK